MTDYPKPKCKCGRDHWEPIPDSLAYYCECGEVIVQVWKGWQRGTSLQEWANRGADHVPGTRHE